VSDHDDLSPLELESAEPLVVLPVHPRTGPSLALTALLLPVIAGVGLCFVDSLIPSIAISGGTIILTAVLLSLDAYRLGERDKAGKRRESPVLLFVAMIVIWVLGYPITYFRRRHFGGPPLGLLSIAAALFFVAAPITCAILAGPELPSCTSPEVTRAVERIIRGSPLGGSVQSVSDFREISFDRDANRRTGECKVRTNLEETSARYVVERSGDSRREIMVRTLPPDLPSCTSPSVTRLLEQLVRSIPMWAKTESITDHREISFDPDANRRVGQCTLKADGIEISGTFRVEFQNRDLGQIMVRFFPDDPPSCINPQVIRLVEQVIRQSPAGPTVKSISDHREIRYDRAAARRVGQCTVKTTAGAGSVKYAVELVNKEKGEIQVRIVGE
jgi:hypothetical protein